MAFDDTFEFNLRDLLKRAMFQEELSQDEQLFLQQAQRDDLEGFQNIINEIGESDEYQKELPNIQKKAQEAQQQQLNKFQQEEFQVQQLMKNQNFTQMGAINKLREEEFTPQILNSGGKKILHFTDTEVKAKNLEERLQLLLRQENIDPDALLNGEKLPENMVLVHTGDIAPDLFDQKEYRFKAFSPEIVADEGGLEGAQREEFIALYKELMDESGITEELFTRGIKTEQDQQLFQRFYSMLLGHQDPDFKTQDELQQFKEKRAKLHSHLEDAILNHSNRHLGEIKEVFDKYGFDSSNFVILSGNHDVPRNVESVFTDSYLREGETKEIRGIKFNRPLGTATGHIYGPTLGRDVMGSNELIEQIPQMRYETEAFSELRDYVKDNGFSHFDDKRIDDLIRMSVMKSQMGLVSGELKNFNDRIEQEVQGKIQERLSRIEDTINREADIYLGHGDITHPQHAGLEETRLRQLLDGTDSVYIGGHQHGETTNRYNESTYINPGASANYNSGSVLLDSNNNLVAAKSFSINPQTQQFENNFRFKQEIASQSVNEGGGSK